MSHLTALPRQLALEPLGPAGLAARGPANDRDQLLIDEQPTLVEPLLPAAVEQRRERRVKTFVKAHTDAAADHVMIYDEPRVEHRAQHHLAHAQVVVERVGVLRLEWQAGHLQHAHHRAIAEREVMVGEVPRVGQPVARASLLAAPRGGALPSKARLHGA